MGKLSIVTARKEGELVGYGVDFIDTHLHYKDHKFAFNDVFFIHPEHRKSTVGVRLFKAVEACLEDMGVVNWIAHVKVHASAAPLLERRGFKKIEYQYAKRIGGA